VAQLLPYLLLLFCPVSMGVMMWMMMRSNQPQQPTPPADPRIAELESQVNELRSALRARGAQEPEPRRTEA
jgi:hypothetical protein